MRTEEDKEIVRYHQERYPDVYAQVVADTIRRTFGEVAVAKVAHSQKLLKDISVEELDRNYRDEKSLTVPLMGLLAEKSLISQPLSKLGRRRSA